MKHSYRFVSSDTDLVPLESDRTWPQAEFEAAYADARDDILARYAAEGVDRSTSGIPLYLSVISELVRRGDFSRPEPEASLYEPTRRS